MTSYKIAVIPGDGIGKEVVPEGLRALEKAAGRFGITFEWDELDWSCDSLGASRPDDARGRPRADRRA